MVFPRILISLFLAGCHPGMWHAITAPQDRAFCDGQAVIGEIQAVELTPEQEAEYWETHRQTPYGPEWCGDDRDTGNDFINWQVERWKYKKWWECR